MGGGFKCSPFNSGLEGFQRYTVHIPVYSIPFKKVRNAGIYTGIQGFIYTCINGIRFVYTVGNPKPLQFNIRLSKGSQLSGYSTDTRPSLNQ